MERGDRLGKPIVLAAVLSKHGEALEFDLLRYCSLDLLDFYRRNGKLTLRRLGVCFRHLPADSATRHAMGDGWTTDAYLLANVIDALTIANWQRGGNKNAARPKPVLRPGDVATKKDREERIARRARQHRAGVRPSMTPYNR